MSLPHAMGPFELDGNVVAGIRHKYFLKVVELGELGQGTCEGEFVSLKAISTASPGFCPEPYAWGRCSQLRPKKHFLLVEFRDIASQPAEPQRLAAGLAELHARSHSPTGKFGFHMRTCHGPIAQAVDVWDASWCNVFKRHLQHIVDLANPILSWPEFATIAELTLDKVVPRLLLPLQADGRSLKPCLVHGDAWDGNCAMDAQSDRAFVFDACSFYAHNEYDTGNWRAPRHRLSNKAYIHHYQLHLPASEPVDDWDARNLLYSLPFNIGNAIHVPGSTQRQVVYEDMTTLCTMLYPNDLDQRMRENHDKTFEPEISTSYR
ncbi:fructosamine kinase domain-containing protein [Hirsutella rhossiliensis]|uniref:protein-ribulosamine 3-kinase n=1 Tax=Hirsutella rhossiliensis TaxID=111463 RepID=A0A9P8SKN8_9HYPO|nr:fructosamine kinase domain-containing protein [Hirsutella rhossiliensis]KAH0966076.1 fructosamine kinase domain-containing protein [Hirsutella rhossiliensis]